MNSYKNWLSFFLATLALAAQSVLAHDPVFGLGSHTLFKGGVELHLGTHMDPSGVSSLSPEFSVKYGITSNWAVGASLSYDHKSGTQKASSLFSKYRFWRVDSFKEQESAALFTKIILKGERADHVSQRTGNDYLLGLSYGYEGRKWYRWAAIRHRLNSDTNSGLKRPGVWLVDLVGGIRFVPTGYHEPDWVWMLELNGEKTERINRPSGIRIGGQQWFLSPGLMWTHRNFAVKSGIQVSLFDDFHQDQNPDNYRLKVELEWHL